MFQTIKWRNDDSSPGGSGSIAQDLNPCTGLPLSHCWNTSTPFPRPHHQELLTPVFFLTFPSAFIEPSCHSLCKKKSKEQEPRGQTVPLSGHLAWQCCPPHGGFLLGTWALSPLTLMESVREAVVRVALQLGVGVTGSVLGALGPALPPEIPEGPLSWGPTTGHRACGSPWWCGCGLA